jgi:hypothetical protein
MREIKPPETQRPPAHATPANAQESVTLASLNPNAEPRRHAPRTLRGDSERHFRAALDAGTRAGSSLSELQKTITHLQSGLTLAANANLNLGQELSALSAVLEVASAQQHALAERVAQLEAELSAAERERQFLIAQQDEFLAALLDEHEAALRARDGAGETTRLGAELAALAEQLARAESLRSQAEAARDEAVASAGRYERERDELRAEASQLRASLGVHRPSTSPPPATSVARAPSFFPAPPLRLDESELDATLHPRSPTPVPPTASEFPRESTRPGVGGPRPSFGPKPAWTPPPPAPETAVTRSPWPASAASLPPDATPSLPTLKRKPDPTTRPLIDYSLGEGGVQSETLEGAKLRSSKPPRT